MTEIEAVVLSHGHMDHTGGFASIMAAIPKKGLPVVAHPAIFRSPRYLESRRKCEGKHAGADPEDMEATGMKLVETRTPLSLSGGDVLFLGEIPRRTDFEKGFPSPSIRKTGWRNGTPSKTTRPWS